MRDHKDLIIDKFIDEISNAFSDVAWHYVETGDANELLTMDQGFDFIDVYISSLPGGHDLSYFQSINELFKSKNLSDKNRCEQFSQFFRTQIKMHIREQIRAMGDGKVGGNVGGY